jgi:hypothetical protein
LAHGFLEFGDPTLHLSFFARGGIAIEERHPLRRRKRGYLFTDPSFSLWFEHFTQNIQG